ncbi:MAG: hypothetical protein GF417_04285 [Candidatus Latescibacteria bacterium]|nr:hypothetical protein [bacterium]MBD3423645.1 hypothetical protein [Candidatus Latescibacterota bacterium]
MYFLRADAPSVFFEAGFGGGIMCTRFNGRARGGRGDLAVGYEFPRHIQPKIQVMYGWYTEESGEYSAASYSRETSALSFSFSIDYSFY